MKSSLAIAAALVLASLAFTTGTAAARGGGFGGGHGQIGMGQSDRGGNHARPAFFGRYGWGYGRGWCYWHPYACYRYNR